MSERGCHYGYFAPTWTRDYAWYMEYKTSRKSFIKNRARVSLVVFSHGIPGNSWKLAEKLHLRKALAKIAHTTI
jgi:hypothetical protein